MSATLLRQIGNALRNLNPADVRSLAERPVVCGVLAADEAIANEIYSFLIPRDVSEARAKQIANNVLRVASEDDFDRCGIGLAEPGVPHPEHFYPFSPYEPGRIVDVILDEREEDWLPLARQFPGFRGPVIDRTILKICKENALFTVATAVPNIIPTWVMLPWAAGEFASDTAFLTMNQVRMSFLIAAASDADVGYSEQSGQIGSIVAAAFGWRALARQLVGKIPAGGGLISKGLVSFAGTYAVGKGLEHYFRFGSKLTRQERKQYYEEAFHRGRSAVHEIVDRVRRHTKAEMSPAGSS